METPGIEPGTARISKLICETGIIRLDHTPKTRIGIILNYETIQFSHQTEGVDFQVMIRSKFLATWSGNEIGSTALSRLSSDQITRISMSTKEFSTPGITRVEFRSSQLSNLCKISLHSHCSRLLNLLSNPKHGEKPGSPPELLYP